MPAKLAAMTPAADDSARLPRVKVVGRRRLRHADWDDARRLLPTVAALRQVSGLCPRVSTGSDASRRPHPWGKCRGASDFWGLAVSSRDPR